MAGAVAVALPGLALAAAALLSPALASFAIEDTRGRPASRTMLLMGTAGAISPIWTLAEGDWSVASTLSLLADPAVLLTAWFCCGIGWLAAALTEATCRIWLTHRTTVTQAGLTEEREAIVAEWGEWLSRPSTTP